MKFREDCIEVVHTAAYDSMAQAGGVSAAVFLAAKVFERALDQVSVAGMHRDDPILYTIKQFQRIFACQERVARIVVYAKIRRIDSRYQIAEHCRRLGKLRVI